MNYKLIINHVLISLLGYIFYTPPYSLSSTILNCSGDIPKKVPCLIKASTYSINVSRIDICKKNPFPSSRFTPNYFGAECINLFNINNENKKINLDKISIFEIPKSIEKFNKDGKYSYISMVLINEFTISGKYKVGDVTYKTGSKGPKDILLDKNKNTKPFKFSERLKNWRGNDDKDNKYCDNGGTYTRCNLSYNGLKLNAIGLNKDFYETYGENTRYLFYLSKLSKPYEISENSTGYFEIKYIKNLEVYGDGVEIKSISIAPFLFKAVYYER
tara:strand:- start:748 stop:1566 length:819 start_codon:yes stop_codon:yes gene_type:complete